MASFALGSGVTDAAALGHSELHGFGVFATQAIPAGSVIFREQPLLRLQSLPNRRDTWVCGNCFRFLGSVEMQLRVLCRLEHRTDCTARKLTDDDGADLSGMIPCGFGCGELYCSEKCQADHWSDRHSVLCTGLIPEHEAASNPLVLFKQYAVETNEILLMVADVFAKLLCDPTILTGGEQSIVEAAHRIDLFRSYVHPQWWDAAVAPDGTDPEELANSLRDIVTTAWEMLNNVFGISAKGLEKVLSIEFISR